MKEAPLERRSATAPTERCGHHKRLVSCAHAEGRGLRGCARIDHRMRGFRDQGRGWFRVGTPGAVRRRGLRRVLQQRRLRHKLGVRSSRRGGARTLLRRARGLLGWGNVLRRSSGCGLSDSSRVHGSSRMQQPSRGSIFLSHRRRLWAAWELRSVGVRPLRLNVYPVARTRRTTRGPRRGRATEIRSSGARCPPSRH